MTDEATTQTTSPSEGVTATAPAATAPKAPEGAKWIWGTGRRKTAVARVRLRSGSGTFQINGRDADAFFTEEKDRRAIFAPLQATETLGKVDVLVNVKGGGRTGQAEAILLGVARALKQYDTELEHTLRNAGLLTRDSRMVERKKYGQSGARRRFQFSKR